MRSAAQTECIKTLIQLKRQEEVIEKTFDNFFDNVKFDPEILRIVKNERSSLTFERINSLNLLRTAMLDTTNCLKEIKSLIKDTQDGRKIDVDTFKEKLISLANKIREFKENFKLESLTNEENELEQDINVFSLVLAKYEIRHSSQCKKSIHNVIMNSHDYSSTTDFDTLIAKTGHTQNWSETDHLFFLKVRKNCRNVSSIVTEIRKKCPDLTIERIVNHEAWYKIYLDLREKQKRTVREWREKKDSEKREKIEKKSYNEENRYETREKNSIDESVGKQTNRNVIFSKSNETIAKPEDNTTRCEKRELLKQWRMDKVNAQSAEIEQTRMETESQRAWKENRRIARANAIKTAIIAHREKKMENVTSSSTTSFTDLDRITSKSDNVKLIKSFRNKDEEFLEKRKSLLLKKKPHPNDILSRKIHNRPNIEQSTLLNPTKGWLEKCKAVNKSDPDFSAQKVCPYVKYIPKLGTCNWRNKESA